MVQTLRINRPDDWHVHLRDNEILQHTVTASAEHFARALIMPNLKPALTSLSSINDYRTRILAALPKGNTFEPYMTFYLNNSVSAEDLNKAAHIPYILGAKLYPAGATTNSEAGAKSLTELYPLFEVLQSNNLVLQIHGEVTHSDIFARESLFIDEYLKPIVSNFPKLRIVFEHISTQTAVEYVLQAPKTVSATITPHHLLYNRNQLLAGGLRPHYYCLPILKHEKDQKALQLAACSGNPKFFAGTDSAPHSVHTKENACGCAGIYSAPFALALYAQVFDELNQLNQLNHFLSHFGAEFYQLPINQQHIELVKSPQIVPDYLPLGVYQVVPIAAGETIQWSIHES
ncbi:dihydroorotase [Legionella cincinnatiensis]|uniref:Dihydroorotase n=1 Tax=Legionella cincinnatiensis TaxID=28085 RepID=A0A378IE35_9GAMM|nr:dihydroorotase [Legionella cincinnatiensis]KTC92210.1 dihydroorotase, homodimeric type [Legionella cincinnatiensis]STX33487.1 dihydroorotase, homodimeric type [Legionella cincinnatiensis]